MVHDMVQHLAQGQTVGPTEGGADAHDNRLLGGIAVLHVEHAKVVERLLIGPGDGVVGLVDQDKLERGGVEFLEAVLADDRGDRGHRDVSHAGGHIVGHLDLDRGIGIRAPAVIERLVDQLGPVG